MHCLSQYIQHMLTLDWLADLHATHRKAFQAKVNEFDMGVIFILTGALVSWV